MNITAINSYQYSLRCDPPLIIKGNILHHRRGLIIEIVSEKTAGYGEIAPLPHFSKETFDEVKEQLKEVKEMGCIENIFRECPPRLSEIGKRLDAEALFPSLQFGLEMSLLNLFGNKSNTSFARHFTDKNLRKVKVSALISLNTPDLTTKVKEILSKGYMDIKLKVNDDVRAGMEKAYRIHDIIKGKALLHLDANQSWDIDTAVRFCSEAVCGSIRYIEEPFKDIHQIPAFFKKTRIPVALDESLLAHPLEEIRDIEGVHFLVLKPTILGGFSKTREIIEQSRKAGINTIISSSFESDIGIWALSQFVAGIEESPFAGLDTLLPFQSNLLKEPVSIQNGHITFSQKSLQKADINFDLLEQVV